jgi:hypothetical protein
LTLTFDHCPILHERRLAWRTPGLLRAVGIKLDAIAKHVGIAGDRLEGHAIANTRVTGGRRGIWKAKKSANQLGFGQGQRIEARPTFADKAQSRPPFW